MTKHKLDHFEEVIRQEVDQLKGLSERSKVSRAPVMLDQQSVGRLSRVDAITQQSMELATEDRRQFRLMALYAALKRIEAGSYGYCFKCDEEIPTDRLKFDPAVTMCVECA